MTALVISNVKPKSADKMEAYAKEAAKSLAPFGGEIVHRGKFEAAFLGAGEPHGLGIMRFPNVQAAKNWFASDEYRALTPLRTEAADMTLTLYNLAG